MKSAPWTVRPSFPPFVALVLAADRAAWFRNLCLACDMQRSTECFAGKGIVSFHVRKIDVPKLEQEAKKRRTSGARGRARAEIG